MRGYVPGLPEPASAKMVEALVDMDDTRDNSGDHLTLDGIKLLRYADLKGPAADFPQK